MNSLYAAEQRLGRGSWWRVERPLVPRVLSQAPPLPPPAPQTVTNSGVGQHGKVQVCRGDFLSNCRSKGFLVYDFDQEVEWRCRPRCHGWRSLRRLALLHYRVRLRGSSHRQAVVSCDLGVAPRYLRLASAAPSPS